MSGEELGRKEQEQQKVGGKNAWGGRQVREGRKEMNIADFGSEDRYRSGQSIHKRHFTHTLNTTHRKGGKKQKH